MIQTDTKQILQDLLAEAELTDDKMFSAFNEIEKGEKELAIVNDSTLRKIWTLATVYGRDTEMAKVEYAYNKDDVSNIERGRKSSVKEDLLREMFWYLVKEKYELWNQTGIGIRKGWLIVASRDNDTQDPSDLLRRLLGR